MKRDGWKTAKLIAIVGPTTVGKSALAVTLARRFGGEIISADSRQVYKGLDVGTGKITEREMRGVPHHLLDVANPKRQFTVAEYQKSAKEKMEEILRRGKLPIICGGTGLYVDSLLKNIVFPKVPPNARLRARLEKKTATELFVLLKKLDPRRAAAIDPRNPRRLIRAIEIAKDAELTRTNPQAGGRGTDAENESSIQPYHALWIGLAVPREELKEEISTRLFARIRKYKMVEEVERLHRYGLSWKRMEELGLEYRYISRYLRGLPRGREATLRGRLTKAEMTEKLQTEIWRYAKRQMTWFKKNKQITWFNPTDTKSITKTVQNFLLGNR